MVNLSGGNGTISKGEYFSLYYFHLEPNANVHAIYSSFVYNINGHIPQWIYCVDGDLKLKISSETDIIEEIDVNSQEFVKIPTNLNEKKIYINSFERGCNYISFSPNPFGDNYDAEKITLYPNTDHNLEVKDYDRYITLFDGIASIENDSGIKKDLVKKLIIRVKAGSKVKLYSNCVSVVGVFWKI